MASDSGVPSTSQLFEDVKSFRSATAFLASIGGTISLAGAYVIANPLQAFAVGLGNLFGQFTNGVADMLAALPVGAAGILQAGAETSAEALRSQGLIAFLLGIGLVFAAAMLFSFFQDIADTDVPFFGRLPFIGPDEED